MSNNVNAHRGSEGSITEQLQQRQAKTNSRLNASEARWPDRLPSPRPVAETLERAVRVVMDVADEMR